MDTNTGIPRTLIWIDFDKSITDMAWAHFDELSRNVSPNTLLSSDSLTTNICESMLFVGIDSSKYMSNIEDIAENILANPYYSSNIKSMYFG